MSIFTWILIAILSSFYWSAIEVTGESSDPVREAATPAALMRPGTGPLVLDSGHATRLAHTQPGATVTYAATDTGLYRSTNVDDWIDVADTPPPGDIAVADATDILMTGEEEHCARGGGGAGVNVSTDAGATWTPSTDERAIRPLAIWAEDAVAIGAWCGGILLSNDVGVTWESPPNDATLGFDVTAFAIVAGTDREVLFSLTGEGGTSSVYHVDLGDPGAWDDLEPIFTYWAFGGLAGNGQTFAVASITGVSISNDAGATWTSDRTGLEGYTLAVDPAIEGLPEGIDPVGLGFRSILLDDVGTPIALGGEFDVFVHNEDGSWEHGIGTGEPTDFMVVTPDRSSILMQAETGVWMIEHEK